MKVRILANALVILSIFISALGNQSIGVNDRTMIKRVPAEWEPQEALWLQWPGRYEKRFQTAFAKMAAVIVEYEKLHILHDSPVVRDQARIALSKQGVNPDHTNIIWHAIANDNAWMRDNGPIYVIQDGEMRIQNWGFNAWGGGFGPDIPYQRDNQVPTKVGEYLNMPVDTIDIVHERGNLEFNGVDTVLVNWTTLGDQSRNPGYTKTQGETDLKHHFGVSRVVFIEGIPTGDLTGGHIDGIARFINPTTVVIPKCTPTSKCQPNDNDDRIYDSAAVTIEAAGFTVIRDPIEGVARFNGETFDTNYINWIVGNGFVIVVGFNNAATDAAAKSRIESYFPGRDVYVIEMLHSWAEGGGGAHCHTNDQPAVSTINFNY